jgi:hypothetical protein
MGRVFLLVLTLALASCARQAVYNVDDRPMPVSVQKLPMERIEALIIEAGQSRQWVFDKAEPGHLVATQSAPKYSASVDIFYDQRTYRISYRTSRGLEEKNGTIHPHYNFWVRNLDKDIETRLANAAVTGR